MPPIGRPAALTPVKRAELCSLVSSGIDLEEAVAYVGCSTRTVRRHAQRDEEFRRTLLQAQLSSRLDPVFFLRKAAEKDWRAAAWLLERTDPDNFLRRDRASCSPQELAIVIDRIVEAALGQIDDQETRTRVYRHATGVARATFNELFPAAAPRGPRLQRQFFPLSEREAIDQMISGAGRTTDPLPASAPFNPHAPTSPRRGPLKRAAPAAPTEARTSECEVIIPAPADKTPASVAKTAAAIDAAPAPQPRRDQRLTARAAATPPAEFCPQGPALQTHGQNAGRPYSGFAAAPRFIRDSR